MAQNNFSIPKFDNKITSFSTPSWGGKPSYSTDVDIVDEMNAYSQLLSKSQKRKYDKTKKEQDSPSFFQKVVSILSTGETGQAVYDMIDGKNPVASYGKSIINSISGQGYDKKTYADVLEKLGMKKGALSELMPWLYNETGEGWKFKKGGLADPTARGALGLTLDILADPTTYLGGAGLVKRGVTSMKGLSKSGQEVATGIAKKYDRLAKSAMNAGDIKKSIELAEEATVKIANKIKSNPDKYFSGLKFMGKEIVPRKIALAPGRYADKTMQHIPIVNKVYAGAKEGIQDVFKYGADVLREGKKLGRTGEETAEAYINYKRKFSREADWSFEKLYRSLNDTRKDFYNAVSKTDRETARKYILDKIETNFSQYGIKNVDNATLDNFINIISKHQDDIAMGQKVSRETLNKDMFELLNGYLPHIMTPEAKKALAKKNIGKYKGSNVLDYFTNPDKKSSLLKFVSESGDELAGNYQALGLQRYDKLAEASYLQKRYSKLLRTQNKYLNEIASKISGEDKKLLNKFLSSENYKNFLSTNADNMTSKMSAKWQSDIVKLDKEIDKISRIISKYEGKGNKVLMEIDNIKKELAEKIDDLPDAGKYFKDKNGKIFTVQRRMSINEINNSDFIKNLMKDMGQEGKNFFETDPFAITLARGQGAIREIEKNSLLREVSEKFGVKGDEMSTAIRSDATRKNIIKTKYLDKYVDNIRYVDPGIKELPEGVLVPDFIVADLKKTVNALKNDDVINKVLKSYDSIMNTWKSSVYGWFPASHGRNLIGGAFMNFNSNPKWVKYTKKVPKIIKGTDDVVDLGSKSIYKSMTAKQLKEEVAKRGMFSQTGALDIMDLNKSFNKSFWNKVQQVPLDAGSVVEQNLRLPLFLAELADGKTLDDAMSTVYRYHFDYAPKAATDIERSVLKRLIPFYTWQRNAIPLMVEQLIETPGRMSSFYKAIRNADDGSGEINRTLLPSFLERDPAIMAGGQAISGLGLPPNEALKFFDDPIGTVEGMITPALKIPIELRTNFNTFKDKQITKDINGEFARNYPQIIKDWLEWDDTSFDADGKEISYSKVNPMRKYWLYALPTGRVSSLVSMWLGDNQQNKMAKFLTGISTIETDLEQMKATKEKEYEEELKEILINAGIYSQYGTAYKDSKTKLKELR